MDKEQVEKKEQQVEASNDAEAKAKKKKSAIKYILNITLILTATALAVYFALKDNADKIFASLTHADVNYLLIILGLMFGCILIRSFILFCFAHLFTRKYHLHQAIAVDQIGEFYNAITPGASGGQIMQAYTYKKQGVQIASAVSILAMYSIVYQVVLIVFGTVSFIAKYDFIHRPLCPWNSPGKNTGMGCHFILQGIFPSQGLKLHLLHCRFFNTEPPGKPGTWKSEGLGKKRIEIAQQAEI